MFTLPSGTELGTLDLVKVFEFYDFPRLFLYRNRVGQFYLGLSVREEGPRNTWLYAPLSPPRLQDLLLGAADLHGAFALNEEGYVCEVVMEEGACSSLKRITCGELTDNDLPLPGEYLPDEAGEAYLPPAPDETLIAKATRRETVSLIMQSPEGRSAEAASRHIGGLLTALQDFIDVLGQSLSGERGERGSIPKDIISQTQMNVCMVFGGSFGIQLRAHRQVDESGESLVGKAISELIDLFRTADNHVKLGTDLQRLGRRAASKYRMLVEVMARMGADFRWHWGSPTRDRRIGLTIQKALTSRLLEVVTRIDTEMGDLLDVPCRLVGANERTRRFEILGAEDSKPYSGRMDEDALTGGIPVTVGEQYIATMRPEIEVHEATGEEKTNWVLVGLRATSDPKMPAG